MSLEPLNYTNCGGYRSDLKESMVAEQIKVVVRDVAEDEQVVSIDIKLSLNV